MDTLKSIAFVLMIPLLATAALLLIAGGGDGVFEEKGIARVDQPKDLVFEWLSEPQHRTKWVHELTSSKTASRSVEKGSKLAEVVGYGSKSSKVEVEVLEAEYGELLALRLTEPGRVVEIRYQLSPHQSARRTRIDVTTSGKLDGWWRKLLEPILAGRITERVDEDLVRLGEAIRGA